MTTFRKNVLSQYLRTMCDKQLRLSLYTPSELRRLGWPVPLTARPAVQILRDQGITWEQAKMHDLETVFGHHVRGTQVNGRFTDTNIAPVLQQDLPSPTFILEAIFDHPELKDTFLRNIGCPEDVFQSMPSFSAFRPDVLWVQRPVDDEVQILPNGNTQIIRPDDNRKALRVCDIKHAGESNSSYSSEVTLYAILLATWLRLVNIDDKYFVSSKIALWTRAKEVSEITQLVTNNPGATISERTQAFWTDLEPVDFQVFFQTIDHFFKTDLPRVLAEHNWEHLDWHVDSRCSNCDFLGHRDWLASPDRDTLDTHPEHYCVTNARDTDHLSRLSTVSRGGRKTLEQAGHNSVTAISDLCSDAPVFEQHNALKADRKHLPRRATALVNSQISIATGTTTIDFPKWADLELFLTVNFDPGTGLLTALGSEARFRQRVPYGQQSQHTRTWDAEAHVLLRSTMEEERNVLISFLSRLAEIFTFAHNTDPEQGGTEAARTRIHIYFWDRRQFEELAKAIGRHLNVIVMPQNHVYLRGLIWLFPPDQLLAEDEIALANPITFLKTAIQRDIRLPIPHCLTIFNVAEAYHTPPYTPSVPSSFYRDPFSDMIPRERIYEIWSEEPLIRLGTVQKTRSQCLAQYANTVKQQVAALRNITWRFRTDMADRLRLVARPLATGVPFNFHHMSEDGRLWLGWAKLEEACKRIDLRRVWTTEPEHLEASYKILRFLDLQSEANDELTYRVRPTSRDCKFRDTESFLALQDERIPGFLDYRIRDILEPPALRQVPVQDRNRPIASVFGATLLDFDRTQLTARVKLSSFGNARQLRQLLIDAGVVDISSDVSLVEDMGPQQANRIRECLVAIGRPPMATAAAATYEALGHAPGVNPPGNDRTTPVARILWDAAALSVEQTAVSDQTIAHTIERIAESHWPLNRYQKTAITHCLSRRLSVVWGPPGTGKTTAAAAMIAARIAIAKTLNTTIRLLITGPTYTAWENLFEKALLLLRDLDILDVACFRVYSSSHSEHTPPPETRHTVIDLEASNYCQDFPVLIQALQEPTGLVVVGTVAHQCYRIANEARHEPLASFFDVVVVDESSQLDVGKALFPLSLLADHGEVSFFGDHLQMPPVVTTQPPRNAQWLVGSIQSYLLHRHNCTTQDLLVNYRSSEPFVSFGKHIGYPPDLSAHSPRLRLHRLIANTDAPPSWNNVVQWLPALFQITDPDLPLLAITYPDGRAGQANDFEAHLVSGIVQQIYLTLSTGLDGEHDSTDTEITAQHTPYTPAVFWNHSLGIVTPHRAQRAMIIYTLRRIFPDHNFDAINAAVDTVERFQGGQRDTIIISFGVGDPDLIADEETFLLQLERTNVAISRARAKCILVISEDLAYHLPSNRETIETSRAVKSFVSDFCRDIALIQVPLPGVPPRRLTLRSHSL